MTRPLCDNCDDPAIELIDQAGVDVVDTSARTDAEIRRAPRRPARWCLRCDSAGQKWRAQQSSHRRTHGRAAPLPRTRAATAERGRVRALARDLCHELLHAHGERATNEIERVLGRAPGFDRLVLREQLVDVARPHVEVLSLDLRLSLGLAEGGA